MNQALQSLVAQCLPGKKVIDLCELGHAVIMEGCSKLYTKKVNGQAVDRGIAFPVCVSVNDIVCNHSPLLSEEPVRDNVLPIRRNEPNLLWSNQVRDDCSPRVAQASFCGCFLSPVLGGRRGELGLVHRPAFDRKSDRRLASLPLAAADRFVYSGHEALSLAWPHYVRMGVG